MVNDYGINVKKTPRLTIHVGALTAWLRDVLIISVLLKLLF